MNEELKQKAQEALGTFIQDALSVREFAIEQAPDVVQQLLMYNFWYSFGWFMWGVMWFVGGGLVAFVGFRCATKFLEKCWQESKKDTAEYNEQHHRDRDPEDCRPARWAFVVIPLLVGFSVGLNCMIHNLGWVKIYLAPKVWLMEYAAGLIK